MCWDVSAKPLYVVCTSSCNKEYLGWSISLFINQSEEKNFLNFPLEFLYTSITEREGHGFFGFLNYSWNILILFSMNLIKLDNVLLWEVNSCIILTSMYLVKKTFFTLKVIQVPMSLTWIWKYAFVEKSWNISLLWPSCRM